MIAQSILEADISERLAKQHQERKKQQEQEDEDERLEQERIANENARDAARLLEIQRQAASYVEEQKHEDVHDRLKKEQERLAKVRLEQLEKERLEKAEIEEKRLKEKNAQLQKYLLDRIRYWGTYLEEPVPNIYQPPFSFSQLQRHPLLETRPNRRPYSFDQFCARATGDCCLKYLQNLILFFGLQSKVDDEARYKKNPIANLLRVLILGVHPDKHPKELEAKANQITTFVNAEADACKKQNK
jgi:flagellar biosynthesis GTPase FlhF